MVAPAGPEGVIPTAHAAVLLAGVLALLAAIFVLSRWGTDLGLSPLPKPPDALEERAREIARRLGWTDSPVDSARDFYRDHAYLTHLAHTGKPGWARDLSKDWWKPAEFEYRQSPRPLLPANTNGEVSRSDPPLNVTGMFTVVLDPEGRLRSFVAVPPQSLSNSFAARPPDWRTLLSEAGLDAKSFVASEPAWLPRVPFDAVAGFSGPMPGGGGETLRVVAAAFRGRPVSFEIVAPWSEPARDAPRPVTRRERISRPLFFFVILALSAAGAWLAQRNARLGRGDRQGATRLAVAVFAAAFVHALLVLHPALVGTIQALFAILLVPTGFAALSRMFYLACEPYFRRRYPDLLVSWARLIGGRFRDPLVGRDLLGGLLLGCAAFLILIAVNAAPAFVASRGETPLFFDRGTLGGMRGVVAAASTRLHFSLMDTLLFSGVFFVGTLLLRRRFLAIGLLWAFVFALEAGQENALMELPAAALIAALLVFALLRFGLVGLAAFSVARYMLFGVPLTPDFSLWYAGYGLFFVLIVFALAAWGFWSARGGGPLLGAAGIDD
jgi:hypothetical protein